MGSFPRTQVPSKFKKLISEKLVEVQIPKVVDDKWLKALGFTGTNDYGLLSVLKFLDLIDHKGVPTETWAVLRNDVGPKLASLLHDKYQELFDLYPNAQLATREELQNFFLQSTDKGKVTVDRMVTNFMALAKIANFNGTSIDTPCQNSAPTEPASMEQTLATADPTLTKSLGTYNSQGLTVNLNIQLTLPESANAELLEQLFASMHKHLLPNG